MKYKEILKSGICPKCGKRLDPDLYGITPDTAFYMVGDPVFLDTKHWYLICLACGFEKASGALIKSNRYEPWELISLVKEKYYYKNRQEILDNYFIKKKTLFTRKDYYIRKTKIDCRLRFFIYSPNKDKLIFTSCYNVYGFKEITWCEAQDEIKEELRIEQDLIKKENKEKTKEDFIKGSIEEEIILEKQEQNNIQENLNQVLEENKQLTEKLDRLEKISGHNYPEIIKILNDRLSNLEKINQT